MSHRIEYIGKLPHTAYVAVSGGADSMAILHFLTMTGKRDIEVLHYNHGTEFGAIGERVVTDYCQRHGITLHVGRNETPIENPNEEYWRNLRYGFFDEFTDRPIILGHNLDDQVETWIFYSLRGTPKLMPVTRDNVTRPFVLTERQTLRNWCQRYKIPFVDDPGNESDKHTRSFIRNTIVPQALKVNPGLYTTIKKKLL